MRFFQIVSVLNTSVINGLNGMIQGIANYVLWIGGFPRKVTVPG
jgi:hypothetical protein